MDSVDVIVLVQRHGAGLSVLDLVDLSISTLIGRFIYIGAELATCCAHQNKFRMKQ